MLAITLLVVLFLGIIFFEAPELVRKKMWRELVAFSVILAIGFVLSLLQILGLALPNPSKIIAYILHIKY